uniref:Uncharacterized protein n=1 Tax=Rhizophora mucronata TaxID=61149 RepID=A0A2P2Q8Y7_RHIMU
MIISMVYLMVCFIASLVALVRVRHCSLV